MIIQMIKRWITEILDQSFVQLILNLVNQTQLKIVNEKLAIDSEQKLY